MSTTNLQWSEGVTLVGGGEIRPENLQHSLTFAPVVVAADGGANHCLSAGITPQAIIGDFDSITKTARNAFEEAAHIHVAEQDTTDFEKCLTRIKSPFILATGFTAPRLDHTLAMLSVLAANPYISIIILAEDDIIFAARKTLELDLPVGTRLSLYPLRPIQGQSTGLKWPIDGLTLDPNGQLGTSNETTGPVSLSFDQPGCLVFTPLTGLAPVLKALVGTASVPAQ